METNKNTCINPWDNMCFFNCSIIVKSINMSQLQEPYYIIIIKNNEYNINSKRSIREVYLIL